MELGASRDSSPAMLYITHRQGGGTERHVQDLARLLEADGTPVFSCRTDQKDAGRVQINRALAPDAVNPASFAVAPQELNNFTEFLHRIGVAHIHVHHLLGLPQRMPEFIRAACSEMPIRYDVTAHDYMTICPRVQLIAGNGVYCGE